ncbi:MAG: peptide chain release factor 2 [Bacteroidota bacterium]
MTSDQLKDIKRRQAALGRYLDVAKLTADIQDNEQKSMDPNFWNDSKSAEALMKTLKGQKAKISDYQHLEQTIGDLEVLFEFFQLEEVSEEELKEQYDSTIELIEDMEMKAMLDQPEDELSCVLTINSGAGGTEANDWSQMLFRMYLMWAEKEGYKVKELNVVEGDVAGLKSVSIEIDGTYAYGYLKGENGVHRLVRISPFNAQGKRQTSFSSVFVYPLVDDTIQIEVNPADLSWDTFRASGAGGQHVNKTESAVRVRHLPSGVVVECQEERSQHLNREKAIKMLKSRLYELELRRKNAERDKVEASKEKIEWGSQIRNYVLHPYKLVKDVRSGYDTSDASGVLDGDLKPFLKAYLLFGKEKPEEEGF